MSCSKHICIITHIIFSLCMNIFWFRDIWRYLAAWVEKIAKHLQKQTFASIFLNQSKQIIAATMMCISI